MAKPTDPVGRQPGTRPDIGVRSGAESGGASPHQPDESGQSGQGNAASTPAQAGRPAVEDPPGGTEPGRKELGGKKPAGEARRTGRAPSGA